MPRRAVTLAELLLVVVLIGVLLAIGIPRVVSVADRAALRAARSNLLRSLDAARGTAIRRGQPIDLISSGGMLQLHDGTGPLWQLPGPEGLGVVLQGLATPIRFGPSGIATGAANRTLRLHRGKDTMMVILSRLGRIR
jgi:prepilin-type N-terminal cleavage/methylation domain-containing protein